MATNYYAYYNDIEQRTYYLTTRNPSTSDVVYSSAGVIANANVVNLYCWGIGVIRWTTSPNPSVGDYVFSGSIGIYYNYSVTVTEVTSGGIKISAGTQEVLPRVSAMDVITDAKTVYISDIDRAKVYECRYDYSKSILAYIKNINANSTTYPIGGETFKGKFTQLTGNTFLLDDITINGNSNKVIDISSYLPNDGYDYEVLLSTDIWTGNTSGDTSSCVIITGNDYGQTPNYYWYGSSVNTRANSYNMSLSTTYCYVPNSYKKIIIRNSYSSSARYWVKIAGYRRVNSNNQSGVRYVSKINEYPIGGDYFDGEYIPLYNELYNASIGSSGSATIDITSIFPDNVYKYMLYGRMVVTTASSSGSSTRLQLSSNLCPYMYACAAKTATSSTEQQKKPFQIPIGVDANNKRTISIDTLSNSSGTGSVIITSTYIRRMGTNE